ncbi:MAG: C25 family cysteine peptidase [bacterium]
MTRFVRVLFLFPALAIAATGTASRTFEFSPGDFVFDRENGFDVVALPGQYWITEPGKPSLPLATYNILIPPDAEVVGVAVTAQSTAALPGEFLMHPAQRAQALSQPRLAFVEPDPATYGADKPYPAEPVSFTRSGSMSGFRIAGVQVAPLSYNPARKQLELSTRIEVTVTFERGRHAVAALDESQVELFEGAVSRLVVNPEAAKSWRPTARVTDDRTTDMMVITTNALAASFQPYVNWKTRAGIKTVVVKTESIYSTYPGRDNQERIRNCVIDYWQNHGVKWVLVGGDAEVVPVRTARITCEGYTEDIATDLYYADLQYSWNSDGNAYFGEMTDSVDLFHDLYIGRTPADNASDVDLFFRKCTTFARNPDPTFIKKAVMGSTMLFSPFHGRVINRMMDELFGPDWTFTHLEDPGSGQYAAQISSGNGISHVAAHGNQTSFSVMSASEAPGLSNGLRKLAFVNSIACQSGWFDGYECLAEALVKAPNGGCIAVCLNSRYGFGYPPGYGPSEMLDLQYYRYLVNKDAFQFGTLNAMSKDHFQSLTMGQEVWRWCVYELNLLGDPSLGMWTEAPTALTVTAPSTITAGPQVVRVSAESGGNPVRGALACIAKGSETYARGWTNSSGWVDLFVSPTTAGSATLSVTGADKTPYDAAITVSGTSANPALVFAGVRVDDSDGNGRLDPGESADLYVKLANLGAAAATGANAVLRTTSTYITRVDSTASFGTIAAGDTVEGDRLRVTASGATPNGTLAEFVLNTVTAQGTWSPYFDLQVGPTPAARKLWADHDTGDMILSMTTLGSIGTLGPYREGSGLKYPRDAGYGSLYFTSLACGNSPSYVVDRWYGQPTTTYNTDWRAVDTLHAVLPPIGAHEEYAAVIDDGAHSSPKGLRVAQWSGALSSPGYRDFVIVVYTLENTGASSIDGLHCGIFSDFDINNTTSNRVFSDANRRLVYMAGSSSYSNSAGIKLLSPAAAANLSAIDHAIYVTPGGMMTEAVKDSFLRGAIHVASSNRAANWSCVASAGPFNLAPGARQKVAFALVGGESAVEMNEHADSAQSWYDHQMPGGITYLRGIVDDPTPGGNGDGIINPGESFNLPVWIANRADRGMSGVWGVLRKTSADTLVTVTDSVRYFGPLGAGDSAWTGSNGFRLRVAAACTNRYALPLNLVCYDTLDSSYTSTPTLLVGAAQLVAAGTQCWDPRPGGNNNGRLDPGETVELALGLSNIGLGNCANVTARLRSGDARLVVNDSAGTYGAIGAGATVFNSADRFGVSASGAIPPETQVSCTLRITGDGYSATRVVLIAVGALTSADPIPDGPRQPALYYAYDDVDTFYVAAPEFEWVEIAGIGTRLTLSDDQTTVVPLPSGFGAFRYYGQNYNQLSICGNGWVGFGSTTASAYSNTALPATSLPPAVFLNWDDLYPPTGGGVWYYHDAANHRFIVEWDSVAYYSSRTTFETNQLILYDSTLAADDGNGIFTVQYLTNAGMSSSTAGAQDPSRAVAMQVLFNGAYHRAAAPIVAGRAILYSTDSVQTGVAEGPVSAKLALRVGVSPNPLRGRATVRFTVPLGGRVSVALYDRAGRRVRSLADCEMAPGRHELSWDGRDEAGRKVAQGVYFLRLDAAGDRRVVKTVMVG